MMRRTRRSTRPFGRRSRRLVAGRSLCTGTTLADPARLLLRDETRQLPAGPPELGTEAGPLDGEPESPSSRRARWLRAYGVADGLR